jgi:hypothetical protein
MRLTGGQGFHIEKTGTRNQGTRFYSATRTCTAAESNSTNFYPLITFAIPSTEFPDFVFAVNISWTIHKNVGNQNSNDLRSTWTGQTWMRGNFFWNSSSDRGFNEQSNGYMNYNYGNFFGGFGFFSLATGQASVVARSAMGVSSLLACQVEAFSSRWDLITSVTYTTS